MYWKINIESELIYEKIVWCFIFSLFLQIIILYNCCYEGHFLFIRFSYPSSDTGTYVTISAFGIIIYVKNMELINCNIINI